MERGEITDVHTISPRHAPSERTTDAERRHSLTALFRREFSTIYRFVLTRCGSPAVAEELASETFVAAARMARAGRIEEVDLAWLYLVARRRLVDHWRSVERDRRRVEKLNLQRRVRQGDELGAAKVNDRTLNALTSLPERQRGALALRYIDDLSVSEVAEALAVTYKTAESLLSRARAGFTKAYEALGVDDERS